MHFSICFMKVISFKHILNNEHHSVIFTVSYIITQQKIYFFLHCSSQTVTVTLTVIPLVCQTSITGVFFQPVRFNRLLHLKRASIYLCESARWAMWFRGPSRSISMSFCRKTTLHYALVE